MKLTRPIVLILESQEEIDYMYDVLNACGTAQRSLHDTLPTPRFGGDLHAMSRRLWNQLHKEISHES